MAKCKTGLIVAACCAGAWPVNASAQDADANPHQGRHDHAMAARDDLGELSFPNSGKAEAQTPFLRGVRLLHNFEYEEAIEAFQQAQKADPNFALAYWGEAMAHNYTLWAEQHTEQA